MAGLKEELNSYPIILSVMPNEYYNESIISVLKQLDNGKICYVSLNKTADALTKIFKSNKINTDKIFFIDAVTKSVNQGKEYGNSIFVSSPYALTELGIAISEVLKTNSFNIVIFDSLSTLSIYQKENKGVTAKFASHIINKIRSNNNKGVFTCLEDDANSQLIKESSMFVDKVVRMSRIKEEMKKRTAKNAAVAAFTVIGLAALSLLMKPSSPTAMVVSEANSGATSMLNSAYMTILIAALMSALIFLMYKLGKNPEAAVKAPEPKIQKLSHSKVRREFKNKIKGWLDAHKMYFF